MIKVKDGYAKLIGVSASGSASHILLSNGGIKAVSDFVSVSTLDNYLPLTGGTLISTERRVLSIDSSNGVTDVAIKCNGIDKSLWGHSENLYTFLSNEVSKAEIRIFDNGSFGFCPDYGYSTVYPILHSGNYSSYALPLSGGTLTGSSNTPLVLKGESTNTWIAFRGSDDTFFGSIGVRNDNFAYLYSGGLTHTIWTSGNDGSGSGLDADLLDGYDIGSIVHYADVYDSGTVRLGKQAVTYWRRETSSGYTDTYGTSLHLFGAYSWANRLDISTSGNIFLYQGINTTNMTKIGQIAMTHSNVASATKLQTARTIWGQSFDGTGNVDGRLTITSGAISGSTWASDYGQLLIYQGNSNSNRYCIGISSNTDGYCEIQSASVGIGAIPLVLQKLGGNVGIGTASPSFKLQVAGDVYCSGWSRSPSGLYIDTGVYYTANSSYPEIVSNGNEIVFASTTSDMYVNYRTSSIRGNTVNTWIWCAGSDTSYASHVMGNLTTIGSIYINTGDPTLKIYSGRITDAKSDGNICLQTSIDGTDGQSHAYPTLYGYRCNLVLQPRGGLVYIGANPDGGNTSYKLYIAGNTYASGSLYAAHFYENSDINLKTNIETITNSDNIPQLKSFDWKSDGKHSYGLIALELEEQGYNELVEDSGDHKTVNYSAALSLIVGKLLVKLQEIEKENKELRDEINSLKNNKLWQS